MVSSRSPFHDNLSPDAALLAPIVPIEPTVLMVGRDLYFILDQMNR